MKYTIILDEQHIEVLKTIFAQIDPIALFVTPPEKPKKLSKSEQGKQAFLDLQARKAARKSK